MEFETDDVICVLYSQWIKYIYDMNKRMFHVFIYFFLLAINLELLLRLVSYSQVSRCLVFEG